MCKASKKHSIKLLALAMVFAAVGALSYTIPASGQLTGNCPGACTMWNGGPFCISPGGTYCYYGVQLLLCECDPVTGCHLTGIANSC